MLWFVLEILSFFFEDVDTTRLNKIILRWCQVIDGTPFECYGAHTNVDPARLVPRCNCTNTEALRVTCNHSVGICQFYPCCYLTAACAIGHSLSLHPTARPWMTSFSVHACSRCHSQRALLAAFGTCQPDRCSTGLVIFMWGRSACVHARMDSFIERLESAVQATDGLFTRLTLTLSL